MLMACLMMSSSWSLAWPGQNWPECECMVKAILAVERDKMPKSKGRSGREAARKGSGLGLASSALRDAFSVTRLRSPRTTGRQARPRRTKGAVWGRWLPRVSSEKIPQAPSSPANTRGGAGCPGNILFSHLILPWTLACCKSYLSSCRAVPHPIDKAAINTLAV